jgi:NADH-quinone oxidoreductase subunit F
MTSFDERSRPEQGESPPDWLADLSPQYRYRVHVCFGKNCTPNGAEAVFRAFQDRIRANHLTDSVDLIATSCRSRCELGPSVNVYPGPVMYGCMDPQRVTVVVSRHLSGAEQPVADFVVSPEDVERAKSGQRRSS